MRTPAQSRAITAFAMSIKIGSIKLYLYVYQFFYTVRPCFVHENVFVYDCNIIN